MAADPQRLMPLVLIGALIAFSLYRRARRTIGRQLFRPKALTFRVVLLLVFAGMTLWSVRASPSALGYALVGALIGAGVALYALEHTRFERLPEGTFYTPHLYIGLAILLLLVGRLIYRFMLMSAQPPAAAPGAANDPFASLLASPLTLSFLFLNFGYYLVYCSGLLRRGNAASAVSAG